LKPGAPLLFVLHPSGGDAASMRQYSNYEFDELAAPRVAPDRHNQEPTMNLQ
jgi:poly(3-hydroxybutyrate) depolymerase